jgi:hypothetical protein
MTQPRNWNFATQHGAMIPCCCMTCPEGGGRWVIDITKDYTAPERHSSGAFF